MFDSQTIQIQGTTSTVLFSPWFPRGGDYGIFTVEVTSMGFTTGGGVELKLSVAMFTKNTSDPGDPANPAAGGVALTDFARTTTGRTSVDFKYNYGTSPAFPGFLELVRYRFTLSGTSTTNTSWATFRMLPPIWYDNVKV